MSFTITVNAAKVARAVDYCVQDLVFNSYLPEAIKAVGVPKRADLVKTLLDDPEFAKGFVGYLTRLVNDGTVLADAFEYGQDRSKSLDRMFTALSVAEDGISNEMTVKQARELLETKGYVVQEPAAKGKKKATKK